MNKTLLAQAFLDPGLVTCVAILDGEIFRLEPIKINQTANSIKISFSPIDVKRSSYHQDLYF